MFRALVRGGASRRSAVPGGVTRGAHLLAAALAALLSACVVVPRTVVGYDSECHVVARQMTLQPLQLASIGGCSNSGCGALLAAAGATAAASLVVSGTIAVAGNVVYWLEKQGHCARTGERVPPSLPPEPQAGR
jgi:hypothetical protein